MFSYFNISVKGNFVSTEAYHVVTSGLSLMFFEQLDLLMIVSES